MSNTPSVISMAPAMATPAPVMTSPSLSPSATAVKQQAVSTATTVTQGAGQLLVTGMGLGGANLTSVAGLNQMIITPSQLTQGWASRALWDGNIKKYIPITWFLSDYRKENIPKCLFYCTFSICVCRFTFFLLQTANFTVLFLSILWKLIHISFTLVYMTFTPKSMVQMCLFSVCWQYFMSYGVMKREIQNPKPLIWH